MQDTFADLVSNRAKRHYAACNSAFYKGFDRRLGLNLEGDAYVDGTFVCCVVYNIPYDIPAAQ